MYPLLHLLNNSPNLKATFFLQAMKLGKGSKAVYKLERLYESCPGGFFEI